jgi:secreted trypsin-like serine protease
MRTDRAKPIAAAVVAGLFAFSSHAQAPPNPPPPATTGQDQQAIDQKACADADAAYARDPSPQNFAALCNSIPAEAVGGVVLSFPGYKIAAPWQAEIYSTYQYTAADIAADAAKPANAVDKFFLDRKEPWERAHRCGGIYLGKGWVLTAAHCVTTASTGPEFLTMREVRLGIYDLSTAGYGFKITAAVIHKDYEKNTDTNDIALLKVDTGTSDADLGVVPARLIGDPGHRRPLAVGARVGVTGWGATAAKADGPMMRSITGSVERASGKLKEVRLYVVSRGRCAAVKPYRGTIGPDVICAGSPVAGQDACTWDSGGPLVRLSDRAVVGIVSRGYGCGLKGVPGIYTRISSYRQWIERAKHAPPGRVSRM